MKKPQVALLALTLTALVAAAAIAQAPPNQAVTGVLIDGCSLSIKADKPIYAAGDSITLQATIKNGGKIPIIGRALLPLQDYKLTVLLPNGKAAPPTLYFTELLGQDIHSRRYVRLAPGQTLTDLIILSRAFDMSLEGNYQITATRLMEERIGTAKTAKLITLPSNPITIVIGEGDQKYYQPTVTSQ